MGQAKALQPRSCTALQLAERKVAVSTTASGGPMLPTVRTPGLIGRLQRNSSFTQLFWSSVQSGLRDISAYMPRRRLLGSLLLALTLCSTAAKLKKNGERLHSPRTSLCRSA